MEIIKSEPIAMPLAKEIIEKKEKDKELGYEQKLALEQLKLFTKLKPAEAKKAISELETIVKMSPEVLVQIVNQLPNNADELRLIFTKEKYSLKEDEINKILEVIKKYI